MDGLFYPEIELERHRVEIRWKSETQLLSRDEFLVVTDETIDKHLCNKDIVELGLCARNLKEKNISVLSIAAGRITEVKSIGGMLKAWMLKFGYESNKSEYSFECKFKSILKEYSRLEKNFKARMNRSGGDQCFSLLKNFLALKLKWESRQCQCKLSTNDGTSRLASNNDTNIPTNFPLSTNRSRKTLRTEELTSLNRLKHQVSALKRESKRNKLEKDAFCLENEKLKRVVGVRTREILTEKQNVEEKSQEEISELKEKLTKNKEKFKHYASPETVKKYKSDLSDIQTANKDLKKQVLSLELKLDGVNQEATSLRQKLTECRKKKRLSDKKTKRLGGKLATLKAKLVDAHQKMRVDKESVKLYYEGIVEELDNKINEGKTTIEEKDRIIQSMKTLETKHVGVYNSETRLLYYDLLTKGVPCNIITDVVRSVLDNVNIDVQNIKLPSRSTAQRMIAEAGHLCKIRLAVEKAKSGSSVAHQSDGTTKIQLHWLSHVIKLPSSNENETEGVKNRTFTLSVSPVVSSSAMETVNNLKFHLETLDDIAKDLGILYTENEYKISSISARMSDRANTEKAVTRLMMEEKEKLLENSDDWNSIADEERQERIKVYSFTCGNHKINNMAEAMTKASADYLYKNDKQQTNSSKKMYGAKQHIYESDKLLCQQSKKEYAKGMDFKCFSISADGDTGTDLFKPIVGSRYLIFLYNAIPCIVGKDSIINFLEFVKDSKDTPGLNKIESSVYSGFFNEKIVAEECAFAICFFEICNALMIKVKSASSPLSLNPFYKYAIEKMQHWATDSSKLLSGEEEIWDGVHQLDTGLGEYMIRVRNIARKPEYAELIKNILKIMCKAGAEKLSNHASEHLDGGEYFHPTPESLDAGLLLGEAHNDKLESKFGMLDRRLEFAPSSNFYNAGCFVQAKCDKPHTWAKQQPINLREAAVSLARKDGAKQLKLAGTRVSQLKHMYEVKSKTVKDRVERRRKMREKREERYTENVNRYGICKLKSDVDRMLSKLQTINEKVRAVKFQITYYKDNKSNMDINKDLFKLSSNGKQLPLQKIKENLCEILDFVCASGIPNPVVVNNVINKLSTSESDSQDSNFESDDTGPPNKKLKSLHFERCPKFLCLGKWYAVWFENSWYPGEVCKIVDECTCIMNFMHPSDMNLNNFKWPVRPDRMTVDKTFLYVEINAPVPQAHGRLWCFEDHSNVDVFFETFE